MSRRSIATRTPKRWRRISYQGKRKTPGTGGGPQYVVDMARDRARKGWLGRSRKSQPGKAGLLGGGVDAGLIAALALRRLTRGSDKPWRRP